MVYCERQAVEPTIVVRRLDNYLFEKHYQIFLDWWRENINHFSNFSFNIKNQGQQFFKDLESGFNFETAFLKIRSDLWGYYLEYIKQESFLPFTNRIKDGRLVGDFYGDKPIVDLVDDQEREGATKKAMEDLEKKLLGLKEGQFIFRVSPKGWTNMSYDYTESQFQIYWKESVDLVRGLTVRTGTNLEQIVELFSHLGLNLNSQMGEKELLKKITATNVVFDQVISLDEVIEMIINISQDSDHHGRQLSKQYERWRKSDSNYQRYDQLVGLLNFTEEKVKIMIDNNEFSRKELEALLGFALLMMAGKERFEKIKEVESQQESFRYYPDSRYPLIDVQQLDITFNYLKSLPGCAGSGISLRNGISQGLFDSFIMTPFGVVEINQQESSSDSLKCVTCPFCKKTVDAEIVNRNGKKYIHCPRCGAEADYN